MNLHGSLSTLWASLLICWTIWGASSCSAPKSPKNPTSTRPDSFVSVADLPGSGRLRFEIRYFGSENFVGRPIEGYERPLCLLTRTAAEALLKAQDDLESRGRRLRIYDCYRPQRAVDDFVRWSKDLSDQRNKGPYYPHVEKSELFRKGYIAERSGHSRGSTVDLTIDGLDMGTPWDLFDARSHTDAQESSASAKANRLELRNLMDRHGFKNLPEEWWHYTLRTEPWPETYFDFPIR